MPSLRKVFGNNFPYEGAPIFERILKCSTKHASAGNASEEHGKTISKCSVREAFSLQDSWSLRALRHPYGAPNQFPQIPHFILDASSTKRPTRPSPLNSFATAKQSRPFSAAAPLALSIQ
jgi:hypothetical protein